MFLSVAADRQIKTDAAHRYDRHPERSVKLSFECFAIGQNDRSDGLF